MLSFRNWNGGTGARSFPPGPQTQSDKGVGWGARHRIWGVSALHAPDARRLNKIIRSTFSFPPKARFQIGPELPGNVAAQVRRDADSERGRSMVGSGSTGRLPGINDECCTGSATEAGECEGPLTVDSAGQEGA